MLTVNAIGRFNEFHTIMITTVSKNGYNLAKEKRCKYEK